MKEKVEIYQEKLEREILVDLRSIYNFILIFYLIFNLFILQAVQVAICDNLNELEKIYPAKRAILVTFNDKVTVVGDGIADKIVIDGDALNDQEKIRYIHQKSPVFESIGKHKKKLRKEVLK